MPLAFRLSTATDHVLSLAADVLVVPVNTAGAMGAGVALAVKEAYPGVYPVYQTLCRTMQPGDLVQLPIEANWRNLTMTLESTAVSPNVQHLWLGATKQFWRHPSRLRWVEQVLGHIATATAHRGATFTVALPALGCGRGGLAWPLVRAAIERTLANSPATITCFSPLD